MKSTAFFNETTGAFAVAVRTEDGDPRIIPQGTAAIIRTRENGAVVFQTPPINLETGTVSPGFLDEKSISGSALVDEAVTADKLAEDAVTEPKIADEAVTADRLAEDAVT